MHCHNNLGSGRKACYMAALPSILAVGALLLVVAFRREIEDWIGRKFFGNQRR